MPSPGRPVSRGGTSSMPRRRTASRASPVGAEAPRPPAEGGRGSAGAPPGKNEDALLAQEIGEFAVRPERVRPAKPVEGDAALDPNAELIAQRHKIADRAEMDVRGLIPRKRQQRR